MKVTIDGYDPHTTTVIKKLSVWNDTEKNKCVGVLKHNSRVKLLERKDEDCLIKVRRWFRSSIVGYIKYWFIKEYKIEYLAYLEKQSKKDYNK